jgi:hypothetical protein
VCYWVYDMVSIKKQIAVVSGLYAFLGACVLVFGVGLGWL